jgi:hypothetical protein
VVSGKSSPCYTTGGTNSPQQNVSSPTHKKTTLKDDQSGIIVETSNDNNKKFEQLIVNLKDSYSSGDESSHKLKSQSKSLENLNQIDEDAKYFLKSLIIKSDAYSQTEGIEDEHLTLLEYIEKYKEKNCKVMKEMAIENCGSKNDESNQTDTFEKGITNEKACENLPLTMPLSEVVNPQKNPPGMKTTNTPIHKTTTAKNVPKANYSLRNQTISSTSTCRQKTEPIIRKNVLHTTYATTKSSLPSTQKTVKKSGASQLSLKSNTSVSNINESYNSVNSKFNISKNSSAKSVGARSKTMIEFSKNTPYRKLNELKKNSSSEDNTNDSTLTLIASTEKLNATKNKSATSIDGKKSSLLKKSGDGEWFTVKTKRKSSWSSRFNQPSYSTSLPALLNESCDDGSDKEQNHERQQEKTKQSSEKKNHPNVQKNKKIPKIHNYQSVVAKHSSNEKSKTLSSSSGIRSVNRNIVSKNKVIAVSEKSNNKSIVKSKQLECDNTIKRQKSDLTGLKIKSLHKEYLRTSTSSSLPSTAKKKKDVSNVELQTNIMISKTIDKLYSELGNAQSSKYSNGILSSCDEIEESDEDQKRLIEEQFNLERQIRELQNSEIDVDTETDDLDDNESSEINDIESLSKEESIINDDDNMTIEMRYAAMFADMSICEREETIATLQELTARNPGRALKLHQKLSSSARGSVLEILKKYQVKHTRALEKRVRIQQQRAQKIQQLIQRVEQVKEAREKLTEDRRTKMEEKLQRATENRENYLKNKIKKAHDEEEKLKEIAFIKNLEMQNKRMDFIESCKEQEVLLLNREQERQKRQTEKLAKEAAVERRRLEIELERKKKLEKLSDTRREREQRVEKIQVERVKIRQEMAREKKRDRDKRLQAIQQQQLQDTEELQRKITKKQEEYQKRHEENIEHIRQRAFELAQQRISDDIKSQTDETSENLENLENTRELSKSAKKKIKKLRDSLQAM